jgi:hypothetical protein
VKQSHPSIVSPGFEHGVAALDGLNTFAWAGVVVVTV